MICRNWNKEAEGWMFFVCTMQITEYLECTPIRFLTMYLEWVFSSRRVKTKEIDRN